MMAIRILFALIVINISYAAGGRILVLFYHPGPSHFYSFYPLFNELAVRGHNVTVLSYTHAKNAHQNYHELLLSELPVINASLTYDEMVRMYTNFVGKKNSSSIFSCHWIEASTQ